MSGVRIRHLACITVLMPLASRAHESAPPSATEGPSESAVSVVDVGPEWLLLDIHPDRPGGEGAWVVVGGRGEPGAANNSAIARTTDGGRSWSRIETPPGRRLYGVAIDSAGRGAAAGLGGTLLRTEDAGASWARLDVDGSPWLSGAACAGPGRFLVVGNDAERGPVLLVSEDGGRSWRDRSDALDWRQGENPPRAIRFHSDDEGWIVGDGGFAARTVDGGETWKRSETNTAVWLRAVHFMDSERGLIGGFQVVLWTDDGGETWRRSELPDVKVNGALRVDDKRAFIATMGGHLLETTDAGGSWIPRPESTPPHALTALVRLDGGDVLIIGDRGRILRIGGTMLE